MAGKRSKEFGSVQKLMVLLSQHIFWIKDQKEMSYGDTVSKSRDGSSMFKAIARPCKTLGKIIWVDYDKEADVLYLSFRKPQRARKTLETEQRPQRNAKLH